MAVFQLHIDPYSSSLALSCAIASCHSCSSIALSWHRRFSDWTPHFTVAFTHVPVTFAGGASHAPLNSHLNAKMMKNSVTQHILHLHDLSFSIYSTLGARRTLPLWPSFPSSLWHTCRWQLQCKWDSRLLPSQSFHTKQSHPLCHSSITRSLAEPIYLPFLAHHRWTTLSTFHSSKSPLLGRNKIITWPLLWIRTFQLSFFDLWWDLPPLLHYLMGCESVLPGPFGI